MALHRGREWRCLVLHCPGWIAARTRSMSTTAWTMHTSHIIAWEVSQVCVVWVWCAASFSLVCNVIQFSPVQDGIFALGKPICAPPRFCQKFPQRCLWKGVGSVRGYNAMFIFEVLCAYFGSACKEPCAHLWSLLLSSSLSSRSSLWPLLLSSWLSSRSSLWPLLLSSWLSSRSCNHHLVSVSQAI